MIAHMGLQRAPLGGFLGGMNLKDSPYDLKHGEAQRVMNANLENLRGAMAVRHGHSPTPVGFPNLPGNFKNFPGGYTVLSIWGELYVLKGGVLTLLLANEVSSNDNEYCFENFEKNFGAGVVDTMWMMGPGELYAEKRWDPAGGLKEWKNAPPGSMCKAWKNRMMVAGHPDFPQRLFYSDIADPEGPVGMENGGYANNWIDIKTSEDDVDAIVWIDVLQDAFVIFKHHSVNIIFDDTTFEFQRLGNVGISGRFQSGELDGRLWFLNEQGVWSATSSGEIRYESENIEPVFTNPLHEFHAPKEFRESSRLSVDRDTGRVYVALCDEHGLVGNYPNNAVWEAYPKLRLYYTRREKPRTPWVRHDFGRSIGAMVGSEATSIKVLSPFAAEDPGIAALFGTFEIGKDGTTPIDFEWVSGFVGIITQEPFERVRRFDMVFRGKADFTVQSDEHPAKTVTMETGALGTKRELKFFRPETRGRYHVVTLRSSGAPATEFYEGEFAVRGGKEHVGT